MGDTDVVAVSYYVYVVISSGMLDSGIGRAKIGMTTQPLRRMHSVGIEEPLMLALFGCPNEDTARELEQELLATLPRIEGEYVLLDDEAMVSLAEASEYRAFSSDDLLEGKRK